MGKISRRDFLIFAGGATACGIGAAAHLAGRRWWEWTPAEEGVIPSKEPPTPWSVEARYYASFAADGSLNCDSCHDTPEGTLPVSYCHIPHTGDYVRCNLCPHHCIIADGERGTCRVRENRGGKLYSMVYGNPCTVNIDPIEKKPFYHYLPTAPAFSLATAGCNLRCLYCQNWIISQVPPEDTQNYDFLPEVLVQMAIGSNAPVIAYTYSEPIIFYEYMLETAKIAREAGLRNAVISAGYINHEPLRELCALVDAIKIDLKGYDENFYREVCEGELAPVLQTLETIAESDTHLEIVNLVVPSLNDSMEQLKALSRWVARDLSPDIPLHFSRFHPDYKLVNLPPTPTETLDQARQIALDEGVRYVYVGNVPGHPGDNTYCPFCEETLITRLGFSVLEYHLFDGVCEYCGTPIPGVWWPKAPEEEPVRVPAGPPV